MDHGCSTHYPWVAVLVAAPPPYRKYNVGTTNMFRSVDVVNPQRITIAMGV